MRSTMIYALQIELAKVEKCVSYAAMPDQGRVADAAQFLWSRTTHLGESMWR